MVNKQIYPVWELDNACGLKCKHKTKRVKGKQENKKLNIDRIRWRKRKWLPRLSWKKLNEKKNVSFTMDRN